MLHQFHWHGIFLERLLKCLSSNFQVTMWLMRIDSVCSKAKKGVKPHRSPNQSGCARPAANFDCLGYTPWQKDFWWHHHTQSHHEHWTAIRYYAWTYLGCSWSVRLNASLILNVCSQRTLSCTRRSFSTVLCHGNRGPKTSAKQDSYKVWHHKPCLYNIRANKWLQKHLAVEGLKW